LVSDAEIDEGVQLLSMALADVAAAASRGAAAS
jgi:hypothetical protein